MLPSWPLCILPPLLFCCFSAISAFFRQALSVSFTVNFSGNTGMFDDFYNEWSGKSNTPWTFDKKNYTATLNY